MENCQTNYTDVVVTLSNLDWCWKQVQVLVDEERLFSAAQMIEKIKLACATLEPLDEVARNILRDIEERQSLLDKVKERSATGKQALHDFNEDTNANWCFAQTYFGVSTHWKTDDNGTIWLKLDGILENVNVFNALAVMKEIDLYKQWVPFCNISTLLSMVARVEVVAHFNIAFPLLNRDVVIHAFGINALYEHRCILLLGGSTTADAFPSVTFPPVKGWGADRADVHAFRALVEPYGRQKSRMCIVVNMDLKCPVPRSLLNFGIKKCAGMLLYLMMREAEKIEADEGSSVHAQRVATDSFYSWLRPRMSKWFIELERSDLPPRHCINHTGT